MRRALYWLSVFACCALLLNACGNSAMPLAREGTLLRKIQDRGKLIAGVKYDLPTFGYLNPQSNRIEGFDPAIAREIAAYLLGDPNKIEFKEAITKNRIPFLKDGTVDLIVSTMTITEERLKDVDFSNVYYTADTRLLVPQDSPIKSVADLDASKKVGANSGSGTVATLAKFSRAQVVLVNTTSEGVQLVLNKQIDAFGGDDTALYGLALINRGLQVVGAPISTEPLGVGIAKGNPELLDAINTVIKNLKSSGKWRTIWKAEIGDKVGIVTLPDPPADGWRK